MTERQDRFEAVFTQNHRRVLGYLLRRVEQPADAADLLAETFLTAWRRFDELPDRADMWLLGTARRVLANHRRGCVRQLQLANRLRDALISTPYKGTSSTSDRIAVALSELSPSDRELLTLTAWEGLGPSDVAIVLRTSDTVTRVRLHRARNRLRNRLATLDLVPSDSPIMS